MKCLTQNLNPLRNIAWSYKEQDKKFKKMSEKINTKERAELYH